MKKTVPVIKAVSPLVGKTISVTWADGRTQSIDLSEMVKRFKVLAPLSRPFVFKTVAVGDWGYSLTWGGDAELSSQTIERLALEQSGQVFDPVSFKKWMQRNHLVANQAAGALGISRRTVVSIKTGKRPVSKTIALACRGWEVTQN